MSEPLKPRQHAVEILRLRSRQARRARLEQVPDSLRPLVKTLVRTQFDLRRRRRG